MTRAPQSRSSASTKLSARCLFEIFRRAAPRASWRLRDVTSAGSRPPRGRSPTHGAPRGRRARAPPPRPPRPPAPPPPPPPPRAGGGGGGGGGGNTSLGTYGNFA